MWAQILATSAAAALVSPVSAKGPWCILWDVVNIRKLLGPTAGTLVSSIVAFPPSATTSGFNGHEFRHKRDVDRKSTRLNSSHSQISYAVFCLKKKNKHIKTAPHRKSHLHS